MALIEQLLRKPETWQGTLGLLPVLMYPTSEPDPRYVLLNGASGNFCLNAALREAGPKERANQAWSCNVGHYVTVDESYVEVSRWDRPDRLERYTASSVAENLVAFHAHLASSAPAVSASISAHYSRAFRRLRSAWRDVGGAAALNAFLYLVACADSKQPKLWEAELTAWDLPPQAKSLASTLSAGDRDALIAHLAGIATAPSLQPDLGLVIRHASGAVFEDAHRIAEAPDQMWFEGFISEAALGPRDASIGINFTPSSIARTLAEEAIAGIDLTRSEIRAFDPACGSAELLKELIRILEKREFAGTLRLTGFDSSEIATAMARFTLAYEKRAPRRFQIEYTVNLCDSLEVPWQSSDIIIMNPPFRRWNDLSEAQQAQTSRVLGVGGTRANYAQAFIHKAVTAVEPGGVLASVVPSALFETNASTVTRAQLAESFAPRLVARLGSQMLFRGSIVDAGLYVGAKIDPSSVSPAVALWADENPDSATTALRALRRRFVTRETTDADGGYAIYPDGVIGRTGKPWRPRSRQAAERWRFAQGNPKLMRAGSYYDIRQGARTGDDVFIVTKEYVSSLPEGERAYFRPAVVNNSIEGAVLNDRFYVFFPHGTDVSSLTSEADLLAHVGTYAEQYLLPKRDKLMRRKHKKENPLWWEMVWPRGWQFEHRPKLVSKYFGCGSFQRHSVVMLSSGYV